MIDLYFEDSSRAGVALYAFAKRVGMPYAMADDSTIKIGKDENGKSYIFKDGKPIDDRVELYETIQKLSSMLPIKSRMRCENCVLWGTPFDTYMGEPVACCSKFPPSEEHGHVFRKSFWCRHFTPKV